jgi:porphobilinogen deaminase
VIDGGDFIASAWVSAPEFLLEGGAVAVPGDVAALAVRALDRVLTLVMALDDPDGRDASLAERALLHRSGATCHSAVSGHATLDRDTVTLRAAAAAWRGRAGVR